MEKIVCLTLGIRNEDRITQSQSFIIESLESVKNENDFKRLENLMHSPLLAFVDIRYFEDPCLVCYFLGLAHNSKASVIFLSFQQDSKLICNCERDTSSISSVFDLSTKTIKAPEQYLKNVQKLLSTLDKLFQRSRDPFAIMKKISEINQKIKEKKNEKEIAWLAHQIREKEKELSDKIWETLDIFFFSTEAQKNMG